MAWNPGKFFNDGNNGSKPKGKSKKPKLHLKIKRSSAEVLVLKGPETPDLVERKITARLILQDLRPDSVSFFATEPLVVGQSVQVQMPEPHPLTVPGHVTYCAILDSRIFSPTSFPYRLQVEFEYLNDGDRATVEAYCEEINKDPHKKAA